MSLMTATASAACEPCASSLSFDESILQADLIIVGQRIDYRAPEESEEQAAPRPVERPDAIRVQIIYLLKGSSEKRVITVNSWDGECDYGIVADDSFYMMILKKGETQYDTLNRGCSFKSLPFDGEDVLVGEQKVNFEKLRQAIERLPKASDSQPD
jgi:hypothetical protein